MSFSFEGKFLCPYCGSPNTTDLEDESGPYELVMDCEICCRPVTLRVQRAGDHFEVQARAENE